MASAAVLQTPELLEMILLHLEIWDLYIVKGVSRSWKALIDDSSQLGRNLWTVAEPRKWAVILKPHELKKRSGYGDELWATSILAIVPITSPLLRNVSIPRIYPVELNDLIFESFLPRSIDLRAANGDGGEVLSDQEGLLDPDDYSCDDMFLTQPPCETITVLVRFARYQGVPRMDTAWHDSRATEYKIHNCDGIRFKHLRDYVRGIKVQGIVKVRVILHGVLVAAELEWKELRERTKRWVPERNDSRCDEAH